MIGYPEIEAKGFNEFRRGESNPYKKGTDHALAWAAGAIKADEFDKKLAQEVDAARRALADDLLRDCLEAFNALPRVLVPSGEPRSTYDIASKIDRYFKEAPNG